MMTMMQFFFLKYNLSYGNNLRLFINLHKLFDEGKLIQIVALEKVDIGYVLWPPATASGVAAEDDNNSNNDDDHGNMDKWLCYNNTNYINRPVG